MEEKLKVGDILWRMHGHEINGAVEWHAVPMCIEKVDEHKFLDGSNCGGSWNSIGKNYFLTREECLNDFKAHPEYHEKLYKAEPEDDQYLGKIVKDDTLIWEDGAFVLVFYGLNMDRMPDEKIPWNKDPTTEYGEWRVTTLGEIREAVIREYKTDFVTVIVEEALHGTIYECGNYSDNYFRIHGETMGYA